MNALVNEVGHLPFWRNKKKGPFRANRILDTDQLKVDQVFTEDGKPVALFTSVKEDQSKKFSAEGYIEGTVIAPKGGAKGLYESDTKWKTYPLFWASNIPDAVPLDRAYPEIREEVQNKLGTALPESIPFHNITHMNTVSISDSAQLEVDENGRTKISGEFVFGDFAVSDSKLIDEEKSKE